ncbi:MAG TPA: cellulose synthase operon protein YhjQ/BcsQ [Pirellulales bacterium]|nr:cellulose synthase operon protein YhjQ/BcsQ [Pirellulales bacterium]
MSTLNQAFIKAYQRRGVAAPHIALPPTATGPSPTSAPTIAPAPVSPAQVERPTGVIPPAHFTARTTTTLVAPTPDRRTIDPAASRVEPAGAVAPPPQVAASATTVAALAGHGKESAAGSALQNLLPAYEVEAFDWPPIVKSLLDRSNDELGSLVGELLPQGRGTLLVTGCRRGEGRTSVALLLARRLVQAGSRVLLVDADFDRPGLAASLATEVDVGWEDTLAASSTEAMIESLTDQMVILPLRQTFAGEEPADGRARFKSSLDGLRTEFDAVCIDAGPVADNDRGRHEMWFDEPAVEAAVVVRDVRHCRLEQSHAVGRQLVQLGVRRWAIIENFV